MALPVVFTQSAKNDVRSACDWDEKETAGLSARFMDDLLAATNRVGGNPEQFAIVYRTVRQCCMSQFPYVVSFRVASDRVEILAVLHGHRDPKQWKTRSS